jgi:hypothetical protein
MTMPIPEGSVVVTPSQMYEEIKETRKAVDRLITTVDPALSDIRGDAAALTLAFHTHVAESVKDASRLTVVETQLRAAWAVLGLLMIAAGVLASFGFR